MRSAARPTAAAARECRDGGPPQEHRMRLSAITQAFVTLSTHQPESVRPAICCVDASNRNVRTADVTGRELMDTGFARNGVGSEGNEGTVGNVEKNTVMRTD